MYQDSNNLAIGMSKLTYSIFENDALDLTLNIQINEALTLNINFAGTMRYRTLLKRHKLVM
ncbi:hypothetical protein GCM10008027_43540 [Pseudoalteromonas gelatinilytica]|uniref:Uncharacterized protein n=1 Tax=Pseudoalteromonas gelatinilytica TaxID=1703256 RepID=A0ABQ1UBQ2_9GAMM|nr:hypothetical protein GCM10008027_43540 [Pseudoalteromonas profundi]